MTGISTFEAIWEASIELCKSLQIQIKLCYDHETLWCLSSYMSDNSQKLNSRVRLHQLKRISYENIESNSNHIAWENRSFQFTAPA